jgi:hypothetical protein
MNRYSIALLHSSIVFALNSRAEIIFRSHMNSLAVFGDQFLLGTGKSRFLQLNPFPDCMS